MPFTFSHPAIMLPLVSMEKKFRSATGLIIGSITPDFEYFIRMDRRSLYSHTLPGLLWFDFPLALLLCFIYHQLIRDPLISNLPGILQSRLSRFRYFNWKSYCASHLFLVSISILIGTASHLFWDAFTHDDGFFVERIDWFTNHFELAGRTIPYYKAFKLFSTIAGGLILLWALLRLPQSSSPTARINPGFWLVCAAVTLLVLSVRIWLNVEFYIDFSMVMTCFAGALLGLVCASLAFRSRSILQQ
jgi:hypothetical protein